MNDGYKIANLPDTVLRFRVQSDFINKRVNENKGCTCLKSENEFPNETPSSWSFIGCGRMDFTHISAESIKTMYKKENKNV